MTQTKFAEIVADIQEGRGSSERFAQRLKMRSPDDRDQIFVIDALRSEAFAPVFRVNEAVVDATGVDRTARDVGNALAIDADKGYAASFRARGPSPNGTYVAEGDSWFSLPWFYQDTLMDALSEAYPIDNLAHWGDEIRDMVATGEFIPFLKTKRVQFLLISGGGNDVLGVDFRRCLNYFSVDHQDPSQAEYYLTRFFYNRLDEIMCAYQAIIDLILNYSPTTRLIVHGYDYVIPAANGVFLGVHMQARGLNPQDRPDLCRAILRLIINKLNDKLAYLAQNYSCVTYVNLRDTIDASEWWDEIHPEAGPARKLADKIAVVLGSAPFVGAQKEAVMATRQHNGKSSEEMRP